LLLTTKFAINSAKAIVTKITPFYVNKGYQLMIHKKLRPISVVSQSAFIQIKKLRSLYTQL
jgi:hypothetical protein